jgi:hypothetical protein
MPAHGNQGCKATLVPGERIDSSAEPQAEAPS